MSAERGPETIHLERECSLPFLSFVVGMKALASISGVRMAEAELRGPTNSGQGEPNFRRMGWPLKLISIADQRGNMKQQQSQPTE